MTETIPVYADDTCDMFVELGTPAAPALVRWSAARPTGRPSRIEGYALLGSGGPVLVDPPAAGEAALVRLLSLLGGPPRATVLTNDWHERAVVRAPRRRDLSRGKVACSAGHQSTTGRRRRGADDRLAPRGVGEGREVTRPIDAQTDVNKALYRRWFEAVVTGGDLALADALLAEAYVLHFPGLPGPVDREGHKRLVAGFRGGFPDWRETVEDVIAEGDRGSSASPGGGPTGARSRGSRPPGER